MPGKLVNLLVVFMLFIPALEAEDSVTVIEILKVSENVELQTVSPSVSCTLSRTNGSGVGGWPYAEVSTGPFIYVDPTACGGAVYPFEITSLSFTLINSVGILWPGYMDVIVYDMAVPGDSCSGPGDIICHYAFYPEEADFRYPNIGAYVFPIPAVLKGHFISGRS